PPPAFGCRSAERPGSAPSSRLGRLHGINLWQMARQTAPAGALVPAHPELAAGRPEIETDRIAPVRGHRLALNRPPSLALRQAGGTALPAAAPATRDMGAGDPAGGGSRPDAGAVHREDPGGTGVARMDSHGKADISPAPGHAPSDAPPGAARPVEPI